MGRDLSPIKDTIANAPVKFERNKIEIKVRIIIINLNNQSIIFSKKFTKLTK
jgi:hypothetical protein